jgi:hypothetical protein
MKPNLSTLSPSITNMIRMDHTHVLAVFRRYHADTSTARKQALVDNACLALQVHAQLEEEIFYPALRAAGASTPELDKSVPEHDEVRRQIGALQMMEAADPGFDRAFRELIRTVLHHVADEETTLLPQAEELLSDRLGELGMQMTKRRMQLLKPHTGELVSTTARTFPGLSMIAAAGALTLGALFLNRRSGRPLRPRLSQRMRPQQRPQLRH